MGDDDNTDDTGSEQTPEQLAAAAAEADAGKTDAEKVAQAEAAAAEAASTKTAEQVAADTAQKAEDDAKEEADKEAADKEAADKKTANQAAYEDPTGVQAVDDVAAILKDLNVPAEDAKALFGEAYETGDMDKIDQEALIKMVGESQARMIMSNLTAAITDRATARTEMIGNIHEAAGGKETFDAGVDWMKGLTEGDFFEQVDEVRDLINGGGLGAKMATEHMIASFKSSSDYEETADLIKATGGASEGSADYISNNDYANALRAATSQVQIDALDARRTRSMAIEAKRRG